MDSNSNNKYKCLMVVGCARTATKGMALFNNHFGVLSYHQRSGPPSYFRLAYYAFTNPPPPINDYINRKINNLNQFTKPHFEAAWDHSNFIYPFSDRYPLLDVVISIRDPAYVCNSLLNYGRGRIYDCIENPAIIYLYHYMRILQQAKIMKKKPRWIEFDDYIKGKYNSAFFNYFGIPDTDKNQQKAHKFLKQRINHGRDYTLRDSPFLFNAGRNLINKIKNEYEEFA